MTGLALNVCFLSFCYGISTPLEHTPKPLPTGYTGIPFIVGQGDCLGFAISGCVVIFLDTNHQLLDSSR